MTPPPNKFWLWYSRAVASPFIGLGLLCSLVVSNVLYQQDPLMSWLRGLDHPKE